MEEDIIGRRAARLFAGLNENGEVSKLSKGEYSGVHYWAGKFYLCNYDEKESQFLQTKTLFVLRFLYQMGNMINQRRP